MNNPKPSKPSILASLVFLALLTFASSVLATVSVTTAVQSGGNPDSGTPFTPTWTPSTSSLISGVAPTVGSGNFSEEINGRNPISLTTPGVSLQLSTVQGFSGYTTSTNYVTGGNNGGGQLLTYTLPASANGYNVTNITVFGGWADSGRSAQGYFIYYSTVAQPTTFIPLSSVGYDPTPSGGVSTRVIFDDANAAIAQNVYALQFNFSSPGEPNGYQGYAAITVQGTLSGPPDLVVSTSTQTGTVGGSVQGTAGSFFNPTYVLETPSLIAGETVESGAVTIGSGNFSEEVTGRNVDYLTAGASLGMTNVENQSGASTTTSTNYVTCGGNGGTEITYQLPTNSIDSGYDLTNIVVYNGWANNGRDGQYYTVSYSTVVTPTVFVPLTTVEYLPGEPANTFIVNRVAISTASGGAMASNVAYVQFNFNPFNANSFNNGYQGYAQIVVQGTNSLAPTAPAAPVLVQDTLPASAVDVVGDTLFFTAAFASNNGAPYALQWQQVAGGVTNNINSGVVNVTSGGVTTSTLTLSGLTTGNAGLYQLAGYNSSNQAGVTFSTAVPLTVNPAPTPDGNIVLAEASETGWGDDGNIGISTNFYPTWEPITPAADLVYGFTEENGQLYDGGGNFNNAGLASLAADSFALPDLLSDGSFGYVTYWSGVGDNATEVTCGDGAGNYVVYDLGSGANSYGFDLTNLVVYGGWGDDGRNEQKYTVSYATFDNSGTFIPLETVDYNPPTSSGTQSATRTTVTPLSSVLAHNVQYVEFDFDFTSAPKNGWEGYSEIVIGGQSSGPPVPELSQDVTPLTAEDVVGSQLTIMAAFNSPYSPEGYQWQFDGTNINGATSTALTLDPLTLSEAGSYVLMATNAGGTNLSSACVVTIDPVPAATNNVITDWAYQTSLANGFSPTWTDPLTSSLIYNFSPTSSAGDFNNAEGGNPSDNAGGLPVLTQGYYGMIDASGNTHPAFAVCGPDGGAGEYVIYTMPDAGAYGDTITSIQIAGGWNDDGRDSQYYTVSYSTIENPTEFNTLAVVQNNLSGYGVSDYTFVRATCKPATGLLAGDVAAIQVNFLSPGGVPNGFSGYAQIAVYGTASAPPPPILTTNVTPLLSDVPVGTPMTFSVAAYSSSPLTYQWSNQSGAISGATSSSYSFNALSGTNSYYAGISNANGSISSATAVVVGEKTNPPPIITIGNGSNWTFNAYPGTGFTATLAASNIIQLTTLTGGEGTSAFYDVGQFDGGFVASFWYQDYFAGGADGVTFCLQNAQGGTSAVGQTGGALGYDGLAPSAAFEMNLYTGAEGGTGIAFGTNGIAATPYGGTGPVNIASDDEIYVQLYYMGGNLEVLLVDPLVGEYTTNYVEDLPAILGNGSAYIGFTGADGGVYSDQFVSALEFSYTTPPFLHVSPGAPGYVVVSWPISVASFFRLEQSSSVTGPWTTAATAPFPTSPDGTHNQVTLPTSGTAEYYKLQLALPNTPPYAPPANP